MNQARSERLDAAAGIAFVVLLLIAAFLPGQPPVATDSIPDIRAFFKDERESLQAATFFTGLAVIAFLWFLGTLRGRLREAEGGSGRLTAVAFGSGLVVAATALAGQALFLTPTLHLTELDDSTVRVLFDASTYVFAMIGFPAAGLTAGTAAVSLRTGALPRAIGAFSAVVAACQVIGAFALYGEDDSFFGIGGASGFLAFLLFLLWVLAVSIAMLVRAYPRTDAPDEADPSEGTPPRAAPRAP
jgi:hypothetical protein